MPKKRKKTNRRIALLLLAPSLALCLFGLLASFVRLNAGLLRSIGVVGRTSFFIRLFSSGLLSPAILLTIIAGLALYFVMDYRVHKRPLFQEDPHVRYSPYHHAKVVTIPLISYKWKSIAFTVGYPTLALVAILMAFGGASLIQGGKVFAYGANEFVTTWKTNNPGVTASNQIRIPTSGIGYNYTVDWGDLSTTSGLTGDATHTYAVAGTYTVKITGTFPRIRFESLVTNDAQKILTVEQWGTNPWVDMDGAFKSATHLTVPATDTPDLSGVISTADMFDGASSFNSDISNWDVSNVQFMSAMFYGASSFNQPLNAWDVSNVTGMQYMFYGATAFNQALDSWDVRNVTDMHGMFIGASSFNADISGWTLDSLVDIGSMFANAASFNQPIGSWNVSQVTDMNAVFAFATSFNQPLNSWDVASATDTSLMFLGATAFNQSLSSWDVSTVADMRGMFQGASAFNQPLSTWQVGAVADMHDMFRQATAFNQNIGGWDVSQVTNMSSMLDSSGLSKSNYDQLLIGWSTQSLQSGVQLGAQGLYYCNSVAQRASIISVHGWTITDAGLDCTVDPSLFITTWKTDNPGTSNSNQITIPTTGVGYNYDVDWGDSSTSSGITGNTTHTYASAGTYTVQISGTFPRIYFANTGDRQKILTVEQWGTNPWDTMNQAFMGATNLTITATDAPDLSGVTNMSNMFNGATSLNQSLNSWNVSNVSNMGSMFFNASSFNQPLNSWNTSNVTSMSGMFAAAAAFNQPLNSWNTSNVTSMSGMFSSATAFNQPLNTWNVSSVTDMGSMFDGASAFNQPLSSWNVGNVTQMTSMFYGATVFDQDIHLWDTSNVTNMSNMFSAASAFNQPLNSWDVSTVTNMTGMFAGALAFNQPLNSWNVGDVTFMVGMFSGARDFNQSLNSWNVGNVVSMAAMFNSAIHFDQSLSSWNVGNVTNMSNMFNTATAFNQSLANWNVSNVTNMTSMFAGGAGLSLANYDATLIGWSALVLKHNVPFDAGTSTYCDAASQRAGIISTYAWTITDAGQVCNDFSLTKTLTTTGAIKSGDTVVYTFKIKNVGGHNSLYGGSVNDVLPTQFTFVSNTNSNVSCSDQGLAQNISSYYATWYTGHHLLVCSPTSGSIALNDGAEITFTITGIATADFTADQTMNMALYVDQTREKSFYTAVTNAISNNIDLFTLAYNNVSTVTYSGTTTTSNPSASYSCTGLTATPDSSNKNHTAPLDVRFSMAATFNNTTAQEYLFDFGDGETANSSLAILSHTYAKAGTYVTKARIKTAAGTSALVSACEASTVVKGKSTSTPAGGGTVPNAPTTKPETATPATPLAGLLPNVKITKQGPAKSGLGWISQLPYYFLSLLLLIALIYSLLAYRDYQRSQAVRKLLARYQLTRSNVHDFLAITSHYLSTPLSIMKGAMELMSSKKVLADTVATQISHDISKLDVAVNKMITTNTDSLAEGTPTKAVTGTVGPVSSDLGSLAKSKTVWLPLISVAVLIAVTDLLLTFKGGYKLASLRLGAVVLFYLLGAVALLITAYVMRRSSQFKKEQRNLIENEQALLARQKEFLGWNAGILDEHYRALTNHSDEFRQVPDARLFFNGLGMLSNTVASLQNVLNFSTIYENVPVESVQVVMTDVLHQYAPQILQKHIKLNVTIPKDLSLQAEPEEARFLLGALLDNAIKFSPENGVITVAGKTSKHGCELTVSDTGPGVPKDKLAQLFLPFSRSSSTETFDYSGMGLSLYTTKVLTEKLGGTISIANNQGPGATATVKLPKLAKVSLGQVGQVIQAQSVSI